MSFISNAAENTKLVVLGRFGDGVGTVAGCCFGKKSKGQIERRTRGERTLEENHVPPT